MDTNISDTQEKLNKENIYKEFQPKVLAYLTGKLCDRNQAEDICSDVFVKVYEKWDTFDSSKASISTWIYTITRNTLYDHYRTTHQTVELDENIAQDIDIVDEICRKETLKTLANCLKHLPERERDILISKYYHKETLKTIAERMNISYGYAKILHNKALAKMKELMN